MGHVSTGGGAKTHFPQKQTSSKLQGRRWWWVDSVTGIHAMFLWPWRGCRVRPVDTGSSVTVLRPDVCPEWIRLEPTDVQLRTATGGLAPMKGRGLLTLTLGGKDVRHPVWVAAVQDPCILGCDFLKATGCRLDLDGGTVSFRGGPVIALLPTGSGLGPPVGSIAPAVCAVEPEVSDPLPVASVTFPRTYVPQAAQAQSRRLEGGASPPTVREIWLKNREGLDDQQQERLWQLLLEFQDSFAMGEDDVGRTPLVLHEHEIDTGEARPIKCRPRRLPLARQEACDQAVEDMLQAGVIEPCDSPWASAVVMVPKKNGTWRLCPDYRPVNGVTKKDSYPLPRIDESLDLVSGSSWFSALDLRSGY